MKPEVALLEAKAKAPLDPEEALSPAPVRPVERAPTWPDPPDEAAHYGLAGDFVRAVEPATEADPMALLVQFLAGVGNLVGRGPHFVAEADRHGLNLFAVLVGMTSKGRKGSSLGQVRRVLAPVDPGWDEERVSMGLSSGEGLIWAVRDPIVKRAEGADVVVDGGVTDKRLLSVEAEFASTLRVLGREGNTLSAIMRQAWDSGTLRTLTKNAPAKATGAHISIIGHITKDELRRYLGSTEAGNGFANRFLWVCTRRSKCLPEGGVPDLAALEDVTQRLMGVVEHARMAGVITRDDEARAKWHAVYPELSEGKLGLLGAVTSRAEAQVMRLACLYALLDISSFVTSRHMEAALAVWDYCEASAEFIFGAALGDPFADEILTLLRGNPDGRTRTEMSAAFGRNRESREIDRALTVLAEYGLAMMTPEGTAGRPAERWKATT